MPFIRFTYLLILFATTTVYCSETEHEDFYTSISGMESLLELEYHLLDNLKDYVDRELAKHQQINLILEDFENENAKALHNPEQYFSSPINVFRAIKRSVVDFKDLEHYILERSNEEDYAMNVTRIESDLNLPVAKEDDLKGAAVGLARLQNTYKLNTSDLAEGRIYDVQYSPAMSASDTYNMGIQLYEAGEFERAFEWFSDTRQRIGSQTSDDWDYVNEVELLDKAAAAAYASGELKLARNLTLELLEMDPHNPDAYENLKFVEMDIFVERNTPKKRQSPEQYRDTVSELYEATCRGELEQTSTEKRPLRCMFVSNNIAFLIIAPFKMEQLSLDPLIVYYHDAIYEDEIDKVLAIASSGIVRSKIGDTDEFLVSMSRTSKNTWLKYDGNDFLANIKQRLKDMTQLNLHTVEALQVANYGIGGHYGPHFDFSPFPDEAYGPGKGNRIATALFYISDIELGGATAFPILKLLVKPIRRSLVLWYNLDESVNLDYRMLHAGCPVLKGSKWILTEWIHERGEELKRPCELQPSGKFGFGNLPVN